MQIKSGIDIIEVSRIQESIDDLGEKFVKKIFTEQEIKYCESKNKNSYNSGYKENKRKEKESYFCCCKSLCKR